MPKMKFISNAKPSLFAYPEALKPPKKEEREKVRNHFPHFKRRNIGRRNICYLEANSSEITTTASLQLPVDKTCLVCLP